MVKNTRSKFASFSTDWSKRVFYTNTQKPKNLTFSKMCISYKDNAFAFRPADARRHLYLYTDYAEKTQAAAGQTKGRGIDFPIDFP